jgi:hypothetical protein
VPGWSRLVASEPQLTRELEAAGALRVRGLFRSRTGGAVETTSRDLDRVASGVVDTSRSQADDQLAELSLTEEEKLVLAKVADILRRIQFGTVVLVVQDGKVVQVEMAEKFRLR